ncbi:MAG TPA: hypothetical protein VF522_03290 [Ramlibacter sp.]|uniref:hypothetical protein n=1 Tax=Ramlibacter sp. TaxID=1917967 RepID=UPI002ED47BDB
MKKFILSAVAAGALAFGGAASAQDLGSIINGIFGIGTPTYNYGYGSNGTPAVVAGTTPYYGQAPYYGSTNQIYADQYGRQFYYDQYGRQVFVQSQSQSNVYGNNVYGNVQYDQWGRPIYGTYSSNSGYRSWDRDGDGVANTQDRWPDDRRYW